MTTTQTSQWRPSRLRNVLAAVAYPVFWLLNRPSMSWFADLIYDFALRCNGIAITFRGGHGLTAAEEHFLFRIKDRLQNGVLLDVGANHGAYARLLHTLAPRARVIAFEPHPTTFAHLQRFLSDQPAIELINKAVGAAAGEVRLYDFQEEDGSTQASLSASAVALYSDKVVEHAVTCTTIDAFMQDNGIERIDFLKIDTEGHDLSVLQGAARALREGRIGLIQFEFIPANIATGVTMRQFFEILPRHRISRLCLNGALRPFKQYDVKRCEIYVTHNLIAVPLSE